MASHPALLGSKLGPRLAMLISQAIVYTHSKLVHVKHKLAMAVFHAMSDEISNEVHETLGGIFGKLHDGLPEDSPAKPSVGFMHTRTGQLSALAGTGLQASGLLSSIATIMNNELAVGVYDTVATNPHMLPDVGTIAQLVATHRTDPAAGVNAIAAQGINNGWANAIISLQNQYPALADGLELIRRGEVTRDQVAEWLGWQGIPENVVGHYFALIESPVSPADAALAVLRGNISQSEGEKIAADGGLSADSFNILIGNTGEPPGLEQLLEAYRRGFIDKATLEKGILQSRYRNEWIPTLEQLRYSPMSVADAVNAVVQDQLDAPTAESIAQQNGLEPGMFSILYNTAGEPLSRTEMEQLYNRGLVTKDQVLQALRESRLKNKYGELAFDLHSKVIEPGILERAVRYGGVTEETAVSRAMESGYSKDDATTIVNSGIQQRIQTHKDRVVSAVAALYETGTIAQSEAETVIRSMGYSQAEATFITQASDFHREARVISGVVNAIRGRYRAWHISENQASGDLDKIGIPASQRDFLIGLWTMERQAFTKTLSEAQIAKAVKLTLITPTEGVARLVNLGYQQADAELLIEGA